ncbi:MAG: glycosyltransferase family 4 protein [Anaerolineae bacterium]
MNTKPTTAILHYSAPPVIGGVELVIKAHAEVMNAFGYPVTVVAGRGEGAALPPKVTLEKRPLLDSRHPEILEVSESLAQGEVPETFDTLAARIAEELEPLLRGFDNIIVHNVFTKRFNLPLTAALHQLLDAGTLPHCIAWCHDLGWVSESSRIYLHPGHPWDLLRTYRPELTYVVVSRERQAELAALLERPAEEIRVVYNGVKPETLLGLTEEGAALVERLALLERDLILLMPVRVTHQKNIELALRVVAALKKKLERPFLVLTGPPDPHDPQSMAYFRDLQALRARLGVEEEMRFVFESGPDPERPYTIDEEVVGDLFRVSDVMFMPSHVEGFGMPVLEAGLVGLPVVSTAVPAAEELAREERILIADDAPPQEIADAILSWAEASRGHRLRRRVRQHLTWQALFRHEIEALLHP